MASLIPDDSTPTTTTTVPAPSQEPTPAPAPAPVPGSRGGSLLPPLPGSEPTEPVMPQYTPEDESVVRGGEVIGEIWEQGAAPTLQEQELNPQAAQQMQDLTNFLARAWVVSGTMEEGEERDELRQLVTDTLGMTHDVMDQERLQELGLMEAMPEDPGRLRQYIDSAKGAVGWALGGNPVGRTITPVLEAVGEIGEGFALGFGETGRALAGQGSLIDAADAVGTGLIRALPGTDDFIGEQELLGKYDTDEDGGVNFRELLGVDADFGGDSWLGLGVGALDTIGLALVDPTSYIGIGLVGRGRAGLQAAEAVGGRALVREVAENGLRNLDDGVRNAIEAEVRRGVTEAFEQGRRMTTVERLRRMDALQAQENQVMQRLSRIETPTGRLSLAGRDFRTPIDTLMEANPLRRQYGELTEAGNVLDTASSGLRRDLATIFGEGIDDVAETSSGLRVSGRIRRRNRDVGSYTRQLLDDGTAIFDESAILPRYQGRGYGTEFLEEQIDGLIDEGFHTIKMVAEGDGALVWGRRGFEFDIDHEQFGPAMDMLGQRLRSKADELEAGLRDGVSEFDADNQLDELADRGIGGFDGGDPDELRMLADQIDIAMRNKNYDLLPDPGSDQWRALSGVVDDTMGFPMIRRLDTPEGARGRVRNFLDDPEGELRQRYGADVTRRSAVDAVPEGIRRQGDRIRPRAAIGRSGVQGGRVRNIADDVRVETQGVSARRFNEMAEEMNASAKEAALEFGGPGRQLGTVRYSHRLQEAIGSADEYARAVLEGDPQLARDLFGMDEAALAAVDPSEFAEMAAKRLDAEGMPATAQYIRDADYWRTQIDSASSRAGLGDEGLRRFYMPRTLTREGRQIIMENQGGIQRQLGGPGTSLGEFGFQSERGFMPDASIEDVNRALARQYNLPEGTKVFEDQVLGAYAARGRSAFRAATEADLFDGLQDEMVDGVPLLMRDDGSQAVRRTAEAENYVDMATPGGTVFVPKDVADAFRQVQDALHSDEWVSKAQEFRRNWSQVWGSNATSPLIDGIGFHSRNATGNLMLNALAGVVNPVDYSRALQLQRTFGRASRAVKKGDSTWDSVWDDLNISKQNQDLIRGLQDHNIMGAGFFDDIATGTSQRGKVYEILGNNVMIRQGRALGNAVEDNARIAHYINKLNAEGGTPLAAARSVRQYLFDYGDLTSFERQLRYVSRFYTFMRKNTGTQMWALLHHPGRVAGLEEAVQSPFSDSSVSSALGLQQANYSRERGDTLTDMLGLEGTVGSVDTPFGAAVETLAPVVELANMIPGLQEVVPGESDSERLVRSLYNLTAGGERAFVDMVYEELTNTDIFTGMELDDESAEAKAMKIVDTIIGPAWSQLDRFVARVTEGEGVWEIGDDASSTTEALGHELVLLSNILGLNVAPYGDRQVTNNLYAINAEWENIVEGMPTVTDLRKVGELPEEERVRRPRSETLAEEIADLQAQGLDTSELEAQLAQEKADEERLGYRVNEDGSYTTQEQRLTSFALGIGMTTESGEGSTSNMAKILFNEANPDDQIIDPKDGKPYDEYDVPRTEMWRTTEGDVREWAEQTGAPLSDKGNVIGATIEAWNAAHPGEQYADNLEDRAKAGGLIAGVLVIENEDGTVTEYRPDGSSSGGSSGGMGALFGE
jgi:hypothetical protein